MRRVLAILGALALLFALVGGATANAPFKEADHEVGLQCWEVPTPVGTAYLEAFVSDLYGDNAFIEVWDGVDTVITRDWDREPTVEFAADGAVAISIPVLPSGDATLTGTTTIVDAVSYDDRFRNGNSTERYRGDGVALAFSGSLTLPGVGSPIPLDSEHCGGYDIERTAFVSQPNAQVRSFTSTDGFCELQNGEGDTAVLFGSTFEDFLWVDGAATDSGGTEIGFYGEGTIGDGTTVIETFEYDPETGNDLGTTGSASISVTDVGETFDYTLRTSNGFQRSTGSLLDVEGQLVTSVGTFDLGGCIATERQVKEVITSPGGPKPGGKRPANDLPSGAIAVTGGYRATVATKGAQQPSEAGYPCLVFEDFDGSSIEIPVEHTVWYRVTGTGSPVTVDTAGSDFDTVIAVYEGAPDAAATVACVDDVPLDPVGRTLQAAVTFDTAAGTTYWIQVGGLNEDLFGESPDVPYGTLKLAVR